MNICKADCALHSSPSFKFINTSIDYSDNTNYTTSKRILHQLKHRRNVSVNQFVMLIINLCSFDLVTFPCILRSSFLRINKKPTMKLILYHINLQHFKWNIYKQKLHWKCWIIKGFITHYRGCFLRFRHQVSEFRPFWTINNFLISLGVQSVLTRAPPMNRRVLLTDKIISQISSIRFSLRKRMLRILRYQRYIQIYYKSQTDHATIKTKNDKKRHNSIKHNILVKRLTARTPTNMRSGPRCSGGISRSFFTSVTLTSGNKSVRLVLDPVM